MQSCEIVLYSIEKYLEVRIVIFVEFLLLEQQSIVVNSRGVGDEKVCLFGRKWRLSIVLWKLGIVESKYLNFRIQKGDCFSLFYLQMFDKVFILDFYIDFS